MEGPGLVLVRPCDDLWCRLGRRLWLARLDLRRPHRGASASDATAAPGSVTTAPSGDRRRPGRSLRRRRVGGVGGARVGHYGGGARGGFGGGGARVGHHGGGRGGGGARAEGGRRSDMRLKHDLVLLGRLDDGLGYYRFTYNGGHTSYVGVMAQEVQNVMPEAVTRDTDGYLRVSYDKLGLPFETYDQWLATGARLPVPKMGAH